jgi:hypothetical protein
MLRLGRTPSLFADAASGIKDRADCAPKEPLLNGREHGGTRAVNSVNAWMVSARIKQITVWRGDLAAEGTRRRSVGRRTNVASLPVPEKKTLAASLDRAAA